MTWAPRFRGTRDVLGLTVLERSPDRAHLSCAGDHADLTVVPGGHGPVTFAIGVDGEDDLDWLERRLDSHGVDHRRLEPDRPGTSVVTEFELNTGHTMQFAVGSEGRSAGVTSFAWDGTSPTPTDIDHINLLGDSPATEVLGFMTEVVGFRYSGSVEVEGELTAVGRAAGTSITTLPTRARHAKEIGFTMSRSQWSTPTTSPRLVTDWRTTTSCSSSGPGDTAAGTSATLVSARTCSPTRSIPAETATSSRAT